LLDRIAIHVAVRPVDIDSWKSPSTSSMTSAAMREMVARAREIQVRRFAQTNGIDCNARIPEGMFATHCAMESGAEALFVRAQKTLLLKMGVMKKFRPIKPASPHLNGNVELSIGSAFHCDLPQHPDRHS
jgi:magnesium chelatase family protein